MLRGEGGGGLVGSGGGGAGMGRLKPIPGFILSSLLIRSWSVAAKV